MVEDAPFETVTKLEAAERQLRVAIRMFFECKDMIAVHALATAAQEIFSELAKKHGQKESPGVFSILYRRKTKVSLSTI